MSLGYYRLIKGKLTVRHRQSPDGDSMRFLPDHPSHLEDLPRYQVPDEVAGLASFQLRFQAIDAPEIHYGGEAQPHGRESRDGLLRWLGVKPRDWDWAVAPEGFAWDQEAAILTDGFDSHGRPIAFVLPPGAIPRARDGSDQQLTLALLKKTYNHHAVAAGHGNGCQVLAIRQSGT